MLFLQNRFLVLVLTLMFVDVVGNADQKLMFNIIKFEIIESFIRFVEF